MLSIAAAISASELDIKRKPLICFHNNQTPR